MAPLLALKGRTHHDQASTNGFESAARNRLAGGSDGAGLAERVQQRGPSDNGIHASGAGGTGYDGTRGTRHRGSRRQANHGHGSGG
jgi:hypothetical protein